MDFQRLTASRVRLFAECASTALLSLWLSGCQEHRSNSQQIRPATVNVQQTFLDVPLIQVYTEVLDEQDHAVSGLTTADFRVMAAGDWLRFESVKTFRNDGAGVAYALLVDVSGSVQAVFPEIQQAARTWIENVTNKDRIALVKVGSSREPPAFSAKSGELLQSVDDLEATDQRTLLYDSLFRTLRAFATESDLPRRRAIVLVTDGRDDDDRSGTTVVKLKEEIENSRVPVFAIGVTPTPPGPNASPALKELAGLAASSGGAYYPLDKSSVEDLYEDIHNRILDAYVGTLRCDSCPHDGAPHGLKVVVRGVESGLVQPPFFGMGLPWYKRRGALGFAALIVALVAVGALYAVRFHRALAESHGRRAQQDEDTQERLRLLAATVRDQQTKTDRIVKVLGPDSQEPDPAAPTKIQLWLVNKRGVGYELEFHDRVTIGKGYDCHVRIADDAIFDHECEIQRRDKGFVLVDRNGNVVHSLAHADEFRVGATKLRFLIG